MAKLSIQDAIAATKANGGSKKETAGNFRADALTIEIRDAAGQVVYSGEAPAAVFAKNDKGTSGIGWMAKPSGSESYKGLPLRLNMLVQVKGLRLTDGDVFDLRDDQDAE